MSGSWSAGDECLLRYDRRKSTYLAAKIAKTHDHNDECTVEVLPGTGENDNDSDAVFKSETRRVSVNHVYKKTKLLDENATAGTKCVYHNKQKGVYVVAKIMKKHFDDVPPYYTIEVLNTGEQRQTELTRLLFAPKAGHSRHTHSVLNSVPNSSIASKSSSNIPSRNRTTHASEREEKASDSAYERVDLRPIARFRPSELAAKAAIGRKYARERQGNRDVSPIPTRNGATYRVDKNSRSRRERSRSPYSNTSADTHMYKGVYTSARHTDRFGRPADSRSRTRLDHGQPDRATPDSCDRREHVFRENTSRNDRGQSPRTRYGDKFEESDKPKLKRGETREDAMAVDEVLDDQLQLLSQITSEIEKLTIQIAGFEDKVKSPNSRKHLRRPIQEAEVTLRLIVLEIESEFMRHEACHCLQSLCRRLSARLRNVKSTCDMM
eukprot:CFRG4037T1